MNRNVLVINNTIFYEVHDNLYINKETGLFFLRLKDLGYQVSTFQISQYKTIKDSFANFQLSEKGIKIHDVKRKTNRFLPFLKSFFIIQRIISQNDFIYIFYPGPICMVIALFCIIYRKPFGLYIRGEQGIESKLSKPILRRASVIYTISPEFTTRILQYNSEVYTIRPMISFDESDIVKVRNVRKDNIINLLYVGRLVFDKGLFELIDALNILKIRDNNIHLNLVGNGTDYDKLAAKVSEYNLRENVTFFGMISDKNQLIEIYRHSDIFVLPTYHEGFPRVLYEAMMMHMPILTTFVGTISHLMKDKYNCLELQVRDIDSIVESIEQLINSPELAQRLSDNGLLTITDYLADKRLNHAEQLDQFIRKSL